MNLHGKIWPYFNELHNICKSSAACGRVVHCGTTSQARPLSTTSSSTGLLGPPSATSSSTQAIPSSMCYDSFPHSLSSYTLCMLLPHAYYFLCTFLFPSTDFLFFHAQPYCLCIASCTVLHSLLTNA